MTQLRALIAVVWAISEFGLYVLCRTEQSSWPCEWSTTGRASSFKKVARISETHQVASVAVKSRSHRLLPLSMAASGSSEALIDQGARLTRPETGSLPYERSSSATRRLSKSDASAQDSHSCCS